MNEALWNKCAEFHGHTCPGLATGFRVATEAMAKLGLDGPEADEELVCVTENDTCAVDAVQVITGCTMGKGNLIYRGTGKMVFTFYCRKSGRGLRVAVKPGDRTMDRAARQNWLLTAPVEEVLSFSQPTRPVPERARIFGNVTCAQCGETVPEHKARLHQGELLCLDCFQPYDRGW